MNGRTFSPRRGASAASRLDRLPRSRWLTSVLGVLFLGWLVESYDIGLTGSVLPSLTHLYHLSTGTKSLVATAATIGIVIGIVPAGILADRWGRKRVLVGGTAAYAILSVLTGLAPDIDTIIVLRLLAGLAMGAVFPLPYAYGSELCPPGLRGRFTGIADSFLSIGYFASPMLAAFLIPTVTNTTGWRVMFFLGGIPLVFAALAWRVLPESPRWYESKGRLEEAESVLREIEERVERELGRPLPPPPPAREDLAPAATKVPLRTLLRPAYLRRSLVLWITFGGTFLVFYAIQTFMPTVVHQMGFTLTSSFVFTAVIVAVSIPGKLLEAVLVERWGRKPVIISFGLVAGAAALAFGLVHGATIVLVVGCVMSFFGIGLDPAVKVYTAESYPTALRATGTATTEGFGRLLSGIVGPALIPPLLVLGGPLAAFVLVGVVALASIAVVAGFGSETRGRSLEESAAVAEVPSAPRVAVRHVA
jgi:putative MFS transporter